MMQWLRDAGVGVLQLLPTNEMARGANVAVLGDQRDGARSHLHQHACGARLHGVGGEARLDLADQVAIRSARNSTRVDYAERAAREGTCAAHGVQSLLGHRVGARHRTRRIVRGVLLVGGVVAGRLRALPRLAGAERRQARGPSGTSRCAAAIRPCSPMRARSSTPTSSSTSTCSGSPTTSGRMRATRPAPVALFGDFPFMVCTDSADVWARQHLFRFDATVGVPPDAFSATGQDWGLPVYRWDVMERDDHRWLRQRARRSARLFHGYRIDHLVGFYRTFSRPIDSAHGSFDPAAQQDQLALGERLMAIFAGCGARIIAEDLGVVPDFVRASLTKLAIPGYKVFRWEREWKRRGEPFCDPAEYPALSVATTGTHDTDPIATWWDTAPADEREAFARLPQIAPVLKGRAAMTEPFAARVARCHPAGALCVWIRPAADSRAGHLRVDRPHQYAGDGHRRQLDVAPALARRHPRRSTRSERTGPRTPRMGRGDGQNPEFGIRSSELASNEARGEVALARRSVACEQLPRIQSPAPLPTETGVERVEQHWAPLFLILWVSRRTGAVIRCACSLTT